MQEIEYQFGCQTIILCLTSRHQRMLHFNTISVSLVVAEKRNDESQADLSVNETFSKTALLLETSIHDPPRNQRYKEVNLASNHNDGTTVSYFEIIIKIINFLIKTKINFIPQILI